ncbi:MAG TPA: 3'-5' exonuclease, partial [Bacteroidales bacterium]|nr:3'-5' exonuclease [Bacteroidales bacterium]
MLDQVNIEKVLFLDIETVPQYPEYEMLPEEIKKLWDHKAQRLAA